MTPLENVKFCGGLLFAETLESGMTGRAFIAAPQHAAIFLADGKLLHDPVVRSLRTSRLLARPQGQNSHGRNAAMRLITFVVQNSYKLSLNKTFSPHINGALLNSDNKFYISKSHSFHRLQ